MSDCDDRYSPSRHYVAPVDCTEAGAEEDCATEYAVQFTNVDDDPLFGLLLWVIASKNDAFNDTYTYPNSPVNTEEMQFRTRGGQPLSDTGGLGTTVVTQAMWSDAEEFGTLSIVNEYDYTVRVGSQVLCRSHADFEAEKHDGVLDGKTTWRETFYESGESINANPDKTRPGETAFYAYNDGSTYNAPPDVTFLMKRDRTLTNGLKVVPEGFQWGQEVLIEGVLWQKSGFYDVTDADFEGWADSEVVDQQMMLRIAIKPDTTWSLIANDGIVLLDYWNQLSYGGRAASAVTSHSVTTCAGTTTVLMPESFVELPLGDRVADDDYFGIQLGHIFYETDNTAFVSGSTSLPIHTAVQVAGINTDYGCWAKINCIEGSVWVVRETSINFPYDDFRQDTAHTPLIAMTEVISQSVAANYVIGMDSITAGSGEDCRAVYRPFSTAYCWESLGAVSCRIWIDAEVEAQETLANTSTIITVTPLSQVTPAVPNDAGFRIFARIPDGFGSDITVSLDVSAPSRDLIYYQRYAPAEFTELRTAWTKTQIDYSPSPPNAALARDSERGYLFVANEKKILTYSIVTKRLWFQSEDYEDITSWSGLVYDERTSTLLMLGETETGYRVYTSTDAGLTGEYRMAINANSAQVAVESERGVLLCVYSDDDNLVWIKRSFTGGVTWTDPEEVYGEGMASQLEGTVGSMVFDARASSLVLMFDEGGGYEIYISKDMGASFELMTP